MAGHQVLVSARFAEIRRTPQDKLTSSSLAHHTQQLVRTSFYYWGSLKRAKEKRHPGVNTKHMALQLRHAERGGWGVLSWAGAVP